MAVKSTMAQRHQSAEKNPRVKEAEGEKPQAPSLGLGAAPPLMVPVGMVTHPQKKLANLPGLEDRFSISSKKDKVTSTGAHEGLDLSGTHRPWGTWL